MNKFDEPAPPLHQTVLFIEKVEPTDLFVVAEGLDLPTNTPRGRSLAYWRERIGGQVGVFKDPWGRSHDISLEAYADDDPETTFLQIGFESPPAHLWEAEAR